MGVACTIYSTVHTHCLFHFLQAIWNRIVKPSSCTWEGLVKSHLIPDRLCFEVSLRDKRVRCDADTIPNDANEKIDAVSTSIMLISSGTLLHDKESYVIGLILPLLALTVNILNMKDSGKYFLQQLEPDVTVHDDRRHNKRSDVSIIKIMKKRTIVLVQCKVGVGHEIMNSDAKAVAQLFLEAHYVHELEGKTYGSILCILTDWIHWHFFLVNVGKLPMELIKYGKMFVDLGERPPKELIKMIINNIFFYSPLYSQQL